MKGFAEVNRHSIAVAVDNWKIKREKGEQALESGIAAYYELNYNRGSKLHKWLNKKLTPRSYAESRIGLFGTYSEVLHTVLNQEDFELLWWWEMRVGTDAAEACEALLAGSSAITLLLDQQLCKFVSKYQEVA